MSNREPQTTLEQRAVEAIRTLPLPSQSASTEENYRRLLAWLYSGEKSAASLVIDIESGVVPDDE